MQAAPWYTYYKKPQLDPPAYDSDVAAYDSDVEVTGVVPAPNDSAAAIDVASPRLPHPMGWNPTPQPQPSQGSTGTGVVPLQHPMGWTPGADPDALNLSRGEDEEINRREDEINRRVDAASAAAPYSDSPRILNQDESTQCNRQFAAAAAADASYPVDRRQNKKQSNNIDPYRNIVDVEKQNLRKRRGNDISMSPEKLLQGIEIPTKLNNVFPIKKGRTPTSRQSLNSLDPLSYVDLNGYTDTSHPEKRSPPKKRGRPKKKAAEDVEFNFSQEHRNMQRNEAVGFAVRDRVKKGPSAGARVKNATRKLPLNKGNATENKKGVTNPAVAQVTQNESSNKSVGYNSDGSSTVTENLSTIRPTNPTKKQGNAQNENQKSVTNPAAIVDGAQVTQKESSNKAADRNNDGSSPQIVPPVKRGRGRPRKHPLPEETAEPANCGPHKVVTVLREVEQIKREVTGNQLILVEALSDVKVHSKREIQKKIGFKNKKTFVDTSYLLKIKGIVHYPEFGTIQLLAVPPETQTVALPEEIAKPAPKEEESPISSPTISDNQGQESSSDETDDDSFNTASSRNKKRKADPTTPVHEDELHRKKKRESPPTKRYGEYTTNNDDASLLSAADEESAAEESTWSPSASLTAAEAMDRKMPARSGGDLRGTAPPQVTLKDPPLSVKFPPEAIAGSTAAAPVATRMTETPSESLDDAPILPGAQAVAHEQEANSRESPGENVARPPNSGGSFNETSTGRQVAVEAVVPDGESVAESVEEVPTPSSPSSVQEPSPEEAQEAASRNDEEEESVVVRPSVNNDPIINMEVINERNVEDDDDLLQRQSVGNINEIDTDRARMIIRVLSKRNDQNERIITEVKRQQMILVNIITFLLVFSGCLLAGLVGFVLYTYR